VGYTAAGESSNLFMSPWHHLNNCNEPSCVFRASSNIYPTLAFSDTEVTKRNLMQCQYAPKKQD